MTERTKQDIAQPAAAVGPSMEEMNAIGRVRRTYLAGKRMV